MEKEQRAKEREKEGERAFYLLSSPSISFVFVLLWWCSLLQSSSPIERKRRGICYSTHHHGRRRSDLLCRRRRLRRRRFFFVFFFFARESKKGKRLEFSSPCVTLLLSLFSLFRWQNLILSSRALSASASLKNSDLFSSLSLLVLFFTTKNKNNKQH